MKPGILTDKTMEDKLYTPNDDNQNYPLSRLKLVLKKLHAICLKHTNQISKLVKVADSDYDVKKLTNKRPL